jgi:ADP-ribosylglycohydrolase
LFVPRSEWFLFASMAVLSCCCAYVPIDENYPDNYIKFMIEKCNSKTIITTDAFQKRVDDIIGDIAGSSREGYSRSVRAPRILLTANSYFTDDTTLTIAVAEWLNNNKDIDLSIYLRKWSNMYPHVGYGSLYKAFVLTGLAQDSRGNGAAMRVAPCAIVAKSLEEALMLAEEQCKITHTNSIAIDGAKAIAAAVFIAKNEREKGTSIADIKEKIKSYIEENFDYNLGMSLQEIQTRSMELAAQRDEFRRTGKMSSTYMNMSSASLSCPMAITAFLLGENYEEVIRCAIAMMGDVDTIACMAGSIAAQVYGIPRQLVDEAIVYLPLEMVEVLSAFEPENNIVASRVTPPEITKWKEKGEIVVYGSGDDDNEKGKYETVASRYNRYPRIGYPIPTIGKTIEEIKNEVDAFINYAKSNPEERFHVRPIGYDKAGYTVEQIAPLFADAKNVTNILLPKEMMSILNW